MRALAARLRDGRAEIARAICAHIQRAVPDAAADRDAVFQAGILPTVTALLDYRLRAIEHGSVRPEQIPPQAEAQARRAARAGIKQSTILRRYVAGHRRLSELIAAEAANLEIPASEEALSRVHAIQGTVLEHLTAAVERTYEQERQHERERAGSSLDRDRMHAVRALLEQDSPSPEKVEKLGYRLNAHHLALVAAGPNAPATLRQLRSERSALLVAPDPDTAWVWLGGEHKPKPSEIQAILNPLAHTRLNVGVGEPAHGAPGWQRTHRQAQDALRAARCAEEPTTVRYSDVVLITPWLRDPELARELIELYLSPLATQRDGGARARKTLRAYFSTGHNLTAAAQRLGVDRRTVSYRLSSIEDALGQPLQTRIVELEVALRVHDLLTPRECTDREEINTNISIVA
jgi:hypothetical protein